MKVVSFDFEMAGLNADFALLLCGCFQTWNEGRPNKTIIFRGDEMPSYKTRPWDDRQLAVALREEINKADVIVGWNSKLFDVPFLNARLAYYGERPCERMKHIDLMYQARYKWKLHSARLESVLDFLNAPAAFTKTKMKPEQWVRAIRGEKKAMDYVVDHCVRDVKALDWVFTHMRHLVGVIHP